MSIFKRSKPVSSESKPVSSESKPEIKPIIDAEYTEWMERLHDIESEIKIIQRTLQRVERKVYRSIDKNDIIDGDGKDTDWLKGLR